MTARGRSARGRLSSGPIYDPYEAGLNAFVKPDKGDFIGRDALQAGCRLLMGRLGVTTVDGIRLTRAFGSHIDPLHAMVLGLIPDCDSDRVEGVGNAAGVGALMVLLSGAARAEVEAVTARIEKVETAIEPTFQSTSSAMAFPHAHLPFPHLASRVVLPTQHGAGTRGGRRRRTAKHAT